MVSKKSAKRAKPQLKVVFDTNAIWTGSNSDLLQQAVLELINEHSNHQDLLVSWHLPDVVRHERQYQMEKASLALLPSIRKLERILGHNLNITEDIVKQRVKETVDKQIAETNLQVLSLDTSKVDWQSMLINSAYRLPPFDSGEKEKGFRDALIAEQCFQLIEDSPVTPSACLIAIIVGDVLLSEFVKANTREAKNVRVFSSLEDVKGLINTLVSTASVEFVEQIQSRAHNYFFIKDDTNSLFYKEKITRQIATKYPNALIDVPDGADVRQTINSRINPTQFVKKEGRRVFWTNSVDINSEAYVFETPEEPSYPFKTNATPLTFSDWITDKPKPLFEKPNPLPSSHDAPPLSSWLNRDVQASNAKFTGLSLYTDRERRLVLRGKATFEITWSVLVSTRKVFSSPRIDEIKYIDTTWTTA